jgi:pyruvate dehydrogenase E1 component alpha subunit
MGLWVPSLGQEGAQVGSGFAMRPQDHIFPSYREHAVGIIRGLDVLNIVRLLRGLTHGGWTAAENGNFHIYTMVLGSQTLHATGYAMGMQRDGGDGAAMAFFGDGASSQGDVNEAFVWASVFNAPVVFFCQNNQWAISEPLERQTRIPLYQRAQGFGFPGVRVDGNDALAVHAVARDALARAREGSGPTLIEAYTYRMGPHTTSDDPTRYRLAAELETWKLKDPIERMKAYLSRGGMADAAFFDSVDADAAELAAHMRAGCLSMSDPDPVALFDHVYAGGSSLLDEERAQLTSYLASFEDAHATTGAGR